MGPHTIYKDWFLKWDLEDKDTKDELRIFHPRLTFFRESFFPKTICEWNKIENDELKSCESKEIFRACICSSYLTKKSCKLYNFGDKMTCISMARMRMGLNHLHYYLFKIGVRDNPKCSLYICDLNDIEDVLHYLLICPHFRSERTELYKDISMIILEQTIDAMSDKLCANLLYGFSVYTTKKNTAHLYLIRFLNLYMILNDFWLINV